MQKCSFPALPYAVHPEPRRCKQDTGSRPYIKTGRCVSCRNLSYGYYCEYKKLPAGSGLERRRQCKGYKIKEDT